MDLDPVREDATSASNQGSLGHRQSSGQNAPPVKRRTGIAWSHTQPRQRRRRPRLGPKHQISRRVAPPTSPLDASVRHNDIEDCGVCHGICLDREAHFPTPGHVELDPFERVNTWTDLARHSRLGWEAMAVLRHATGKFNQRSGNRRGIRRSEVDPPLVNGVDRHAGCWRLHPNDEPCILRGLLQRIFNIVRRCTCEGRSCARESNSNAKRTGEHCPDSPNEIGNGSVRSKRPRNRNGQPEKSARRSVAGSAWGVYRKRSAARRPSLVSREFQFMRLASHALP